jgi:hypothetical protein
MNYAIGAMLGGFVIVWVFRIRDRKRILKLEESLHRIRNKAIQYNLPDLYREIDDEINKDDLRE